MPGAHVGDGHGDKIGRYPVPALFIALKAFALDGGQTADAAGDQYAAAERIFFLHVETAHLKGFLGGGNGHLVAPVHFPGFPFVHVVFCFKAVGFAGQLDLLAFGVIQGDGADAAFALFGALPGGCKAAAQGADDAHAGDDHSSVLIHGVFLL